MLQPETNYPFVGSYALFVDPDAAAPQAAELVRTLARREEYTLVSFPLRDGASGNKVVPAADLIDASPLTIEETREFHDLDRLLGARAQCDLSKAQRAKAKRRNALKQRIIYEPVMLRLLRQARSQAEQRRAA